MSGTTTETAGREDDPLRTRQSLLTRLKDWNEHAGWREFSDTYWRLIYNAARKSGLGDQDALLGVAKQMPEGRYDRSKGRFKQWLCGIVRHRVADGGEVCRLAEPLDAKWRSLDFTPDSGMLAIVWNDGVAAVHDLASGRERRAFEVMPRPAKPEVATFGSCHVFAPDSGRIATAVRFLGSPDGGR
jgi:hypothetical protein